MRSPTYSSQKLTTIRQLPQVLNVAHAPNPVRAIAGSHPGIPETQDPKYTWTFATEVTSAAEQPVVVIEFGAFVLRDQVWSFETKTGEPFTNRDFAEWYDCADGILEPGVRYCDPGNWHQCDELLAESTLWYFMGATDDGLAVAGEGILESLAELTPPDTDSGGATP